MNILQGYQPSSEPPPEAKEIKTLVLRLEKVIREYVQPAHKMGLTISAKDIFEVLDLVATKAADKKVELPWQDTAQGFFLAGLYEELIQQPSTIFSQITDAHGDTFYVPLSREIWQTCLKGLRDHLAAELK